MDEKINQVATNSTALNNCVTTWPYDLYKALNPPPNATVNIRACENGFIITCGGKEYIALSAKDVTDAVKKLLKTDKK